MNYTEVKDSGVREEMSTGSRRDTQEGKPRPDLIPPQISHRDGMHYANGAKKYGDHNWLLGQPSSRYMASLKRHVEAYERGDRSEDHLAAIRWNAGGVMMNEELVSKGIYPESMHDIINWEAMEAECAANGRPYTEQELRVKLGMDVPEPANAATVDRKCVTCKNRSMPSSMPPCFGCDHFSNWTQP